jgi:hypothetical protein
MVIQRVTNDKVAFRMVVNTMTFFTGDIGLKTLGLKIEKNICWITERGGESVIEKFNNFLTI